MKPKEISLLLENVQGNIDVLKNLRPKVGQKEIEMIDATIKANEESVQLLINLYNQ